MCKFVLVRVCRYRPFVPRCVLFRNPESGHELGTNSAEGTIASGGSGAVIGTSVWSSLDATSMIVKATPATRASKPSTSGAFRGRRGAGGGAGGTIVAAAGAEMGAGGSTGISMAGWVSCGGRTGVFRTSGAASSTA